MPPQHPGGVASVASPAMPSEQGSRTSDGADLLIELGFVFVSETGREPAAAVTSGLDDFSASLRDELPAFEWQIELVTTPRRMLDWQVDPMELLEIGVQQKIIRGWDLCFVITETPLKARDRVSTCGVPSSALETAVVGLGDLSGDSARLTHICRFLFASLLGLEQAQEGAMEHPGNFCGASFADFSSRERTLLSERLKEVSDERIEERGGRWSAVGFRWRTFLADPQGILSDIRGYRPWLQPFRLGRLSGAALVATLFSFLGAEVWELGVGLRGDALCLMGTTAVLASTTFLFRGQRLSSITGHGLLSEQVTRTEIVSFAVLGVGMISLWLLLAVSSVVVAFLLPREVVESWIGSDLDQAAKVRFAMFVSTLGTLAGALGGSLEEESDFKARFLFDEEV